MHYIKLINFNFKLSDQIVMTGESSIDKVEVDQSMNKIIGEEILEAM